MKQYTNPYILFNEKRPDPKRIFNEDGSFAPTTKRTDKTTVSIEYIEELCEWIFYKEDIDNGSKLELILPLEDLIIRILRDFQLNYTPYWSVKLLK